MMHPKNKIYVYLSPSDAFFDVNQGSKKNNMD